MSVILGACRYFLVYNAHLPTSPPFDILAAFCGLLFVTNMSVCMFPTVFLDVIFQTLKFFAKNLKNSKFSKNLPKISKFSKFMHIFKILEFLGKIPNFIPILQIQSCFSLFFEKSLFFCLHKLPFSRKIFSFRSKGRILA